MPLLTGGLKKFVETNEIFDNFISTCFQDLYENHNEISIGYKEDEIVNPNDMLRYYSKENIDKYGVLGIKIVLKR